MKFVSYQTPGDAQPHVGYLDGDVIVDVGFAGDMVAFISANAPIGITTKVTDGRIVAPLRPPVMRDFLAFEGHLRNAFAGLGRPIPDEWFHVPAYYKGIPSTVIGPDDEIPWPSYTERLDHELEVAAIIGRPGRDISPSAAMEHVFGFTLWNDMTARDIQSRELPVGMGPAKAKDWDGSNVLGPCIVTIDEVDPASIDLRVCVNGEQWGADTTANMYHSFADLITYSSHDMTLHPGELIGSGTCANGSGLEQDRWLQPGDLIEMSSPQLGVLRNRVGQRSASNTRDIERSGIAELTIHGT